MQNPSLHKTFSVLRPFILPALGFVVVMLALVIGINSIGLDNIRGAIENAGPLAPLVFIALRAATYVAAPLTTGPLLFASGMIFDPLPAIVYSLTGEVLGGSLNFTIARLLGRPFVRRLVGEDGMARVDSFTNGLATWQLLAYARLFLFSVWDFLSYAAGFTHVKFRTYFLVSVIVGAIPTSAAVLVGNVLVDGRGELVLLYVLVAVATLLPILLQRHIKRWLKLDKPATDTIGVQPEGE